MKQFKFPEILTKRLAIKVNKHAERSIKQKHPWIFENSITKENKAGDPGDIAIIFDSQENKLMAVGLYDPDSPIRIKIVSFGEPATIDKSFFIAKFTEAKLKRDKLLEHTDAYRLIYGENDGLPGLIIDIYGAHAVIKLYSRIWIPYLKVMSNALNECLSLDCQLLRLSRTVAKYNDRTEIMEGVVIQGTLTSEEIIFNEYEVQFKINIRKGHKTGFFLDHRDNRRLFGTLARDKKVLDVFCYAGGFSAHAMKHGAKSITSMDISAQALQLAKENVSLNSTGAKHQLICGDAFDELEKLILAGEKYDLIVIDPPSFAKREKEREVALRKYTQLAEYGSSLLTDEGILILASCSSRISSDEFKKSNAVGFRRSQKSLTAYMETSHDVDHPVVIPEAHYLKCIYYRST